jgi:hypothetical protein
MSKKKKTESQLQVTLTHDPGLTATDAQGMREFYEFFEIPMRAEMDAVLKKFEAGIDTISDVNQFRLLLTADLAIGVHKMFRDKAFKSIRKNARWIIGNQKD